MEDPFFVVRDEVQKTVNSIQELYRRWQDLLNNPSTAGKDEFTWTTNEIKNNIRSVEWDLEDLEETIGIVEANPSKFTLSANEISSRKGFIGNVRKTAQSIKDDISSLETKAKVEKSNRQSLMGGSSKYQAGNKYSKLENDMEKSNQKFIDDSQQQQQALLRRQDEQLVDVGQSVGVLKSIGVRIDNELDEQAVLLDDLGNEIEMTDSKLQTMLIRVEKVLRLADDKKQTYVLITLIVIMIVVIILFVAL